jgi:hypothetical protein
MIICTPYLPETAQVENNADHQLYYTATFQGTSKALEFSRQPPFKGKLILDILTQPPALRSGKDFRPLRFLTSLPYFANHRDNRQDQDHPPGPGAYISPEQP